MQISLHARAGKAHGWGHYFRMTALGEELVKRGHRVIFSLDSDDELLCRRALEFGIEVTSPGRMNAMQLPDLAIIDDYEPDFELMEAIREGRGQIVQIVDAGTSERVPGATVIRPDPLEPIDGSCSGLDYTMISSDVRHLVREKIAHSEGRVAVVVGGEGNDHEQRVGTELTSLLDVEVVFPRSAMRRDSVDRTEFLKILATSAMCITGAGTTLWECLALGVPPLALVVAENQRPQAVWAERNGLCLMAEVQDLNVVVSRVRTLIESPILRREMSESGRRAIDGNGVIRIANFLEVRYGSRV